MKKNHLVILFLLVLFFSNCNSDAGSENHDKINPQLTREDSTFLDSVQYRTFRYFIDETNHKNGLVRDRTQDWSVASISATGWGVMAWAIGAEHNWISREKARELTLNLLNFLLNSEQSANKDATGYKGFYYHFLNMETGKREWNSELSTIDTAWLLAGIRFAAQYYNKDNDKEKQIREIADSLVNRVEWDWTIIQKSRHEGHENLIAMGYKPEEGLGDFGWYGYTEALYLYILAAGTNLSNPLKAYSQWQSGYKWEEPYKGLGHVIFPPLFGHQYSFMMIDFRNLADDYMKKKGIDYFENSKRATLSNREFCIQNPNGWVGYDSLTWGISACDGPGDFKQDGKKFYSYAGRGATGPNDFYFDDGTLTPTAAGGSVPFAPEICIATLKNMYDKYGSKGLWGKYGFKDAFNLTLNWFDKDYLGLDEGPILIMIENYRTGLIWKYAMKDPIIQKGLSRLGITKLN